MIEGIKNFTRKVLLKASPALLFKLQHYKLHKQYGVHAYWARISNPSTFNEHIIRNKLNSQYLDLGYQFVDKCEVKRYVARLVGSRHVIPNYGVFKSAYELARSSFSKPCVIKPTHLSGRVIMKPSGYQQLDMAEVKTVEQWFYINQYYRTGEPQYLDLKPRVIVEAMIGKNGIAPTDYKIFCWRGRPLYIQVDVGRYLHHERCFFDVEWNPLDITLQYPPCTSLPLRPVHLEKMIEMAKTLSADFDFVRVDLYAEHNEIFFGEMTFHPGSGNEPFGSYEMDLAFGRQFGDR